MAAPWLPFEALNILSVQFLEFVRTIDAKFKKYDEEGALCWLFYFHRTR